MGLAEGIIDDNCFIIFSIKNSETRLPLAHRALWDAYSAAVLQPPEPTPSEERQRPRQAMELTVPRPQRPPPIGSRQVAQAAPLEISINSNNRPEIGKKIKITNMKMLRK